MQIGDRIKQRRLELGYSVDKVADLLGKNRATIYRYENNEIENFPTTVLEPLAKILNTTPAHLMGWEENSSDSKIDYFYDILDKAILLIEKKGYKVIESDNSDILNIVNESNEVVKTLSTGDLVSNYENLLDTKSAESINQLLGISSKTALIAAHADGLTREEQEKVVEYIELLKLKKGLK